MKKFIPIKNIVVFSVIFLCAAGFYIDASTYTGLKVSGIRIHFDNYKNAKYRESLKKLILLKPGGDYDLKKVRSSIDNIFKVGIFRNVEVRTEKFSQDEILVYFNCLGKRIVDRIRFTGISISDKKKLINSFRSIRKGSWFSIEDIDSAILEIREYLKSRGYFNPNVNYELISKKFRVNIDFKIEKRSGTYINAIFIRGKIPISLPVNLSDQYVKKRYIPEILDSEVVKIKKFLVERDFYFPNISIKRVFLDRDKTKVNLYINIDTGYKYVFKFSGIKDLSYLVSPIWAKKVFDKWAEKESIVRINSYLRNKGYLNPIINSKISIEENRKIVIFTIRKNRRYTLGKIHFSGNRNFSEKILKDIITVDDIIFDRIFYLRNNSIKVDIEVLKWFYYFKGYPLVRVTAESKFNKKTVDLKYIIDEGAHFVVKSIKIEGILLPDKRSLKRVFRTTAGAPFVQRILDEDIVRLRNLYYSNGFDDVNISLRLSRGEKKDIYVNVSEGTEYRFGSLIIVGASKPQASFIKRNFLLKKGGKFNRLLVEKGRNRIEKDGIFSEIKYIKLKNGNNIDLLIITTPNNSKYLGFGVGYEERTNARLTFEYQKKNIFRSYSTLSTLIQFGLKERRGIVVLDTPSIIKGGIDSTLRIWEENETYRSYKFNRFGISEAFIKKLSPYSYILFSLSWYRTKLLELDITESSIDRLGEPFDTTALTLSYVIDNRDDPFLPAKGEFFSTDIKFAFPLVQKDYSFFRFRWGYQKNVRLFKRGIFSFSLRNGFASGNLSITERFFGGGINTFRGISNDRLGPLDKLTGEPAGGNAMLLINLESTFPLYLIPIDNFYYSVFFDIGNIYKGVNEFALKNIERALGIGLRIKTAIGLLKFDVAYNFRKRENVNPIVFHIGIGNVL